MKSIVNTSFDTRLQKAMIFTASWFCPTIYFWLLRKVVLLLHEKEALGLKRAERCITTREHVIRGPLSVTTVLAADKNTHSRKPTYPPMLQVTAVSTKQILMIIKPTHESLTNLLQQCSNTHVAKAQEVRAFMSAWN